MRGVSRGKAKPRFCRNRIKTAGMRFRSENGILDFRGNQEFIGLVADAPRSGASWPKTTVFG
jgi:hypothetical protein